MEFTKVEGHEWEADVRPDPQDQLGRHVFIHCGGIPIAKVHQTNFLFDEAAEARKEQWANAKVLAKAPQMYHVLKLIGDGYISMTEVIPLERDGEPVTMKEMVNEILFEISIST